MQWFYFLISCATSVIGAICGIGGGVIIKPALDALAFDSVATNAFLSGCTVLSMSAYSVGRSLRDGDNRVDFKHTTPLAVGAAIGGVTGKQIFSSLQAIYLNADAVGAVQAACLAVVTLGTLLYTVSQREIHTLHTQNLFLCTGIGFVLGNMSSFLGIGGGPINLVVLYYFFSMDTKTAVQNSLYIILFSQLASVGTMVATGRIPDFGWDCLLLMLLGGLGGAATGRRINKKLSPGTVERLFIGLMIAIISICGYNIWRYIV